MTDIQRADRAASSQKKFHICIDLEVLVTGLVMIELRDILNTKHNIH